MEAYRQRYRKCVVPGCKDWGSKRHTFPKNDIELFGKWIKQVQNSLLNDKSYEQIYKNYKVCDIHFSEHFRVPGTKRGLRKDAFPTEYLPACPFLSDKQIGCINPAISLSTDHFTNSLADGIRNKLGQLLSVTPLSALEPEETSTIEKDDAMIASASKNVDESRLVVTTLTPACPTPSDLPLTPKNNKMELDAHTLNLRQICRTCKCVAPQMCSLFGDYENAHQSFRIDEMLMTCASVQVMWGDGLPAQICEICVEQLRNAFVFKRQVERIDAFLREYAKNVNVEEIKQEPQNPDFVEPLTLSNLLNEQTQESNQEPFASPVIRKIDTDYIQFLDNDRMLLTCHKCSKIFSTINELRCHKRVHTEKSYKCSQCYKQYAKLNQLRRHEELHSQKKVHVCKICSKMVVRRENLKRHLVTHLLEKSFSFNTCNDNHTEVPTIENIDNIEEQFYQVDRDFMFSDYSDIDESETEVTESIGEDKVKEVVDMGLSGGKNDTSQTSGNGGNCNDHNSGAEKVTECAGNEIDEPKEVKVENILIMEGNIPNDGCDSVKMEYVNVEEDKITEVVGMGLNDDNHARGVETIMQCQDNEIGDLKEVKEEDSWETEDNIVEGEDETTNTESEEENSGDTTDSEYHPKINLSLKIKPCRSRPNKGPLESLKIKKKEKEYKEVPCPVCHEIFSSMRAFDKHARMKHEGVKMYKCDVCNKQFNDTSNLKRHVHCHSIVKTHCCHICSKSFKTRGTLRQHQKQHQTTEGFACDICQKILRRADGLANHRASRHGIGAKNFQCPLCPKSFATESYRDIHTKKHNRRKEYQCSTCEETFLSKYYLTRHMQANGDCAKKFLCTECGQRFRRKDYFATHMLRHRGEKPFKCKYCEKSFPRMVDLQVHERYHTGEKTHLCTICGKGFGRAYNLTLHMRTHTGEKPHQCPYCDAAFRQKNDLNVHIRRHTGERFQCELCNKGFLMTYKLNQHKRTVHGLNIVGKTRGVPVVSEQENLDEPSPSTAPLPKLVAPDNAVLDNSVLNNAVLDNVCPT